MCASQAVHNNRKKYSKMPKIKYLAKCLIQGHQVPTLLKTKLFMYYFIISVPPLQDANECWTALVRCLQKRLPATSLPTASEAVSELGKYKYIYSSPSLSGHSQQRPPSLIKPQIFAAATVKVVTSPSQQRPPLKCGQK